MKTALMEEQALKHTIKTAVEEVFDERMDMMSDLLEEALLDIGLSRAISEGAHSRTISRRAVFEIMKTRS